MSIPIELLTAEEAYAADRMAEKGGMASATLMEHAGRAVADAICMRWGVRPALVVAGTGNNGGDGLIVARLLKERGWPVQTIPVAEFKPSHLAKKELVVDAIFGVGLNRPPKGIAKDAVEASNACGAPVVAVDIPSGIMADSGEAPGAAIQATLTVTFFRAKPGLFLLPGKQHAGLVQVADIGIPARVLETLKPKCALNAAPQFPALAMAGHKYTRGAAIVQGGPLSCTGAAKLAAKAALRAGAGLVAVACDKESLPAYAASLASVMTKLAGTTQEYETLIHDKRFTALLLGPGNGVDDVMRQRITAALSSHKPVVLDADALTVLAQNRNSLLPQLHASCVLTPHEGEFARLFDIKGDKLSRARAAAKKAGCVVLLKGNDTVIAAPDGRAVINANAPAWLATAGAGDVLSGIITGLLAQGMQPFAAACAGAWLHGEAAGYSGRGMIAEDLPELLLKVLR